MLTPHPLDTTHPLDSVSLERLVLAALTERSGEITIHPGGYVRVTYPRPNVLRRIVRSMKGQY